MDRDGEGNYPTTRIVPITAEAYREVTLDPLGRAKNNMQGRIPVPPDHAYGIKCIGSDTTVGDCLRGWYSEEEQKAEPDLGKCIKALLFPQADSRCLMTISLQFQCIISH